MIQQIAMRFVKYKRHEFREKHPANRNEEVARFLLDIPYLLYFGVIPSREAINEVLRKGGGDAGMSPGASWEPFELTEDEYWEIVERWDQMDIEKEREEDHFRYNPKMFVKDDEIMNIPEHTNYLRLSRKKYESLYLG